MLSILMEYANVRRLFGRLGRGLGDGLRGRSVVFTMIRTHVKHVWDLEFFLAVMLARFGARVTIVVDDGAFCHWDSRQHTDALSLTPEGLNPWYSVPGRLKSHILRALNQIAYRTPGIGFLRTSEFIKGRGATRQASDADAVIRKNAESSTRRFFQIGRVDLRQADQRQYYELSLVNSLLSKHVGEYVVNRLRPDLVITSHGIYSTWGPAYEVFRSCGVPTLVYGIHPYIPGSIQLSEQPLQLTDVDQDLQRFMGLEWTNGQRSQAMRCFRERAGHTAHDTKIYHRGARSMDLSTTIPRPVLGIFPSVIWDGDIEERNRLFEGMYEWVSQTVRYFYRRDDQSLVIRFHPSESTLETRSVPLQRILEAEFPDLTRRSNIQVIPSSQPTDTYDLIRRQLDAVLIYDGILALEAPLLGRPTILCGRGRFSSLGVGLEPQTPDEYFGMLHDVPGIQRNWDGESHAERALKVLYWYMFPGAYKIPQLDPRVVISSIERRPTDLSALRPVDVDPHRNPDLQRTLNKIGRSLGATELVG